MVGRAGQRAVFEVYKPAFWTMTTSCVSLACWCVVWSSRSNYIMAVEQKLMSGGGKSLGRQVCRLWSYDLETLIHQNKCLKTRKPSEKNFLCVCGTKIKTYQGHWWGTSLLLDGLSQDAKPMSHLDHFKGRKKIHGKKVEIDGWLVKRCLPYGLWVDLCRGAPTGPFGGARLASFCREPAGNQRSDRKTCRAARLDSKSYGPQAPDSSCTMSIWLWLKGKVGKPTCFCSLSVWDGRLKWKMIGLMLLF